MAEIKGMSIQGIRSFSPFEPKTIHFFKPLTIIVGDNGCGKTTIIECLKVACTGTLPPNIASGQSFISDPKLSQQEEVKGQIRLEFISQDGQINRCTRSYTLSDNKGKLTFKSLDQSLKTVDKNGKYNSTSNRGRDMDILIPTMLGMSKAIIENVIFCHQDEANWPLADSRELKKRFDLIFGSTFYTKSLEAIRKERKDKKDQLTQCEKDEIDKRGKYVQAGKLRAQLKQLDTDISSKQEQLMRSRETLNYQLRDSERLATELRECDQIRQSIDTYQFHLQQQKARVDSTRASLPEELSMSEDMMGLELATIQKNSESSLSSLRSKQEEKKRAEENLRAVKMKVDQLYRSYITDQTRLKENKKRIKEIIEDIITYTSNSSVIDTLKLFLSSMSSSDSQQLLEITMDDWKNVEKATEQVRDELSSEVDKLRDQQKELEALNKEAIDAKQKLEVEERVARQGIMSEIAQINRRIREIDDQIKQHDLQLRRTLPFGIDGTKQLNKQKEEERMRLSAQLKILEKEIQEMETGNSVKAIQDELMKCQSELELLQRRWEELVKAQAPGSSSFLLDMMKQAEQDLQSCLADAKLSQDVDAGSLIASLEGLENDLIRVKAEEGKLSEIERQLNELTTAVEEGHKEVMEGYSTYNLESKDYYDILNEFQNRNQIWTLGLLTTLSKHYHVMCLQEARLQLEPTKLTVQNQIRSLTNSLRAKEMVVKATKKRLEELQGVKEVLYRYNRCRRDYEKQGNIEQAESELASLRQEIAQKRSQEQKLKEQLVTEEKIMQVKRRQAYVQESEIKMKIEQLLHDQDFNSRAIEDAESRQPLIAKLNEERASLQSSLMEKESKQSAILSQQQVSSQLQTLRENAVAASQAVTEGSQYLYRMVAKVENLSRQIESLKSLNIIVTQDKMTEISKQMKEQQSLYLELEKSCHEIETAIDTMKQQTDSINLRVSILTSNIQLRRDIAQMNSLTEKINNLQSQLDQVNVSRALSDYNSLTDKITENQSRISQLEGEVLQLTRQKDSIINELNSPDLDDIDRVYVLAQSRVRFLSALLSDLEIYMHGIEAGLLQYHQAKIKEINERISELWMATYQGQDIESIKIESKPVKRGAKDIFDYSVYMVKNHSRLQMRGRCSAGQKALASLVIRIALADSFCSHCGILALDEPTTNLDHENKVSLVHSLAHIISQRRQQQNFQLIVITHDEEFGQLLTQAGLGNRMSYYRISREESKHVRGMFVSNIERQTWS